MPCMGLVFTTLLDLVAKRNFSAHFRILSWTLLIVMWVMLWCGWKWSRAHQNAESLIFNRCMQMFFIFSLPLLVLLFLLWVTSSRVLFDAYVLCTLLQTFMILPGTVLGVSYLALRERCPRLRLFTDTALFSTRAQRVRVHQDRHPMSEQVARSSREVEVAGEA